MSTGQLSWSPTTAAPRRLSRGWLSVFVMAVILGLMGLGYAATLKPVTLIVDGREQVIRTNQRAVENILREAGIPIAPEDMIGPELTATLADGQSTIIVQHARPVVVAADGHTYRFRTQATSLRAILDEADLKLHEHDLAIVNNQPISFSTDRDYQFSRAPDDLSTLRINVQRAVPITLDLGDGQPRQIETAATTVGQALAAAGVQLYLADRVSPDLTAPLRPNLRIEVQQSRPVRVIVDGRTLRTRTLRSAIGDVLTDLGVTLVGEDYTQPPLDAPVEANTEVQVVRVKEDIFIEQEIIPYDTVRIADPTMELDTYNETAGANGIRQKRTVIRYENGQEVRRDTDPDFIVLQQPVNKEYRYGTNIVIRTVQTPDGPVEYWRKIRAYATSYSAATSGTPKTAKWYGITATGLPMRKGIVAVDPSVIRLGTKLYVEGYGVGLAADTGGGVRGRWVDLGYDDDNLQGWWWWVDVYLLTPVPADIPYSLPNWPTYPDRRR